MNSMTLVRQIKFLRGEPRILLADHGILQVPEVHCGMSGGAAEFQGDIG